MERWKQTHTHTHSLSLSLVSILYCVNLIVFEFVVMFVSIQCDHAVILHSDTWWNGKDSSDTYPSFLFIVMIAQAVVWRRGEVRRSRRNPKIKIIPSGTRQTLG
jgi:hypothetical protein